MAFSDNTATNLLINQFGFNEINAYIVNLGIKNTFLKRHMLDFESAKKGHDNTTTPFDTVKILQHLSKNDLALSIMSKQNTYDRLTRYIFNDIKFYGKNGELDNTYNDSGIFIFNNKKIFASVFIMNIDKCLSAEICGLCGLIALNKTSFMI